MDSNNNNNNNEADFLDKYCKKLDIVFNLLLIDIPDHYDDTLNSKVLDSISSLVKHEQIQVFLHDHLQTIKFIDLESKDFEIQTFFLNLFSILTDAGQITSDFLDKIIIYLTNIQHLDSALDYASLNLLIKLISSNLHDNLALNSFIHVNYLENFSLFYDKSIFICKLYEILVEIYLKKLYKSKKYAEIDVYFEKLHNYRSNYDILFAVFDVFLWLFKNLDVVDHLDGKLNVLLHDVDLNSLADNLKSINSLESYCYIWFKIQKIEDLNTVVNMLLLKPTRSFLFKFFYYLYNLVECKSRILELYMLPINDFNVSKEDNYMKLAVNFKQKEQILNDCLLNFSIFSKDLRLSFLNVSNLSVILKHFNLSFKIKTNLLKLLFKIMLNHHEEKSVDKTGTYYLLFSILHDYSATLSDLNENLLDIFLIFLNNSEDNENDELIESQLFSYMLKYQCKNNRNIILKALTSLNNENFSFKLLSFNNYSFLNDICSSLFNLNDETKCENDDIFTDDDDTNDLKELLLKCFQKYYKIILNSPLKPLIDTHILDKNLYLSSNMPTRIALVEFINQLFKFYLDINNTDKLRLYFDYYSFILRQISNDYYNQDVYDVEIKCLNIFNTILNLKNYDIINIFIDSALSSVLNFVNNDFYYSENNKINYYKNIKLVSIKFILNLYNFLTENLKKSINELNLDQLLLICENCCHEESDLYLSNPLNILDDIISSYEFNMNDNKISDCY
jgi:hypothetical protein